MTVPGKGGKPIRYTPEELEEGIIGYFKFVDETNKERRLKRFSEQKFKPYTISGICVYLDISRDTWAGYSKRPEYADSIKRAKTIVENFVEEGLLNGQVNAIGAIFNLKNNFGWVDKQEVVTTQAPQKLSIEELEAIENAE